MRFSIKFLDETARLCNDLIVIAVDTFVIVMDFYGDDTSYRNVPQLGMLSLIVS